MRPVRHLASVVLPLPDSPTRPKVSPRRSAERHVAHGRELLAPVLEGAHHVVDGQHVGSASLGLQRLVASTGADCGILGTSSLK